MLQFDGKLDGYIPGWWLRWLQRFGRVSAAAWFRLQLRPLNPGKKWDAISAVFGAMSIGFPRRLWTLGAGLSALAVLCVTIGVGNALV